jgi:hypothetical protein
MQFHHQPINVPTAGAQAFLMDYPQGERAITHHAGPEWIMQFRSFIILLGTVVVTAILKN